MWLRDNIDRSPNRHQLSSNSVHLVGAIVATLSIRENDPMVNSGLTVKAAIQKRLAKHTKIRRFIMPHDEHAENEFAGIVISHTLTEMARENYFRSVRPALGKINVPALEIMASLQEVELPRSVLTT